MGGVLAVALLLSGGSSTPAVAASATEGGDLGWIVVSRSNGVLHLEVLEQPDLGIGHLDGVRAAGTDIVLIERDSWVEVEADAGLGDPRRSQQAHLAVLPFVDLHARFDGTGIRVAVIDTSIAHGHEDLPPLLQGFDAVEDQLLHPEEWVLGDTDHGTHVVGLLAATAENGLGGTGVAPGVEVVPVRVLGPTSGRVSDVVQGVLWALTQDVDIMNLSLGTGSESAALALAMQQAEAAGIVVVAAAGNLGRAGDPVRYPAAIDTVLAVGAVESDLSHWPRSSRADYLDVVAPGVGVLSSGGFASDSYVELSGTSMAVPQVSGLIALLLQADPTLTPAELRQIVRSTATDLGPEGHDIEFGEGLLDPMAALELVNPAPPEPPPPPVEDPELPPVDDEPTVTGFIEFWVLTDRGRLLLTGSSVQPAATGGAGVVGGALASDGAGHWFVDATGAVGVGGTAVHLGDVGGLPLNQPIVGMSLTGSGEGYWLVAADGGVFAFGDAQFHGSTGALTLNEPIVDMALSPSGEGYWLVAADGGVFAFGDAVFHGSTGDLHLNRPVVSLATGSDGYWLVAADGGVFGFGVIYHGSLPELGGALSGVVGQRMRAIEGGAGYVLLTADGALHGFGSAAVHSAPPLGLADGERAVDLLVVEP